MQAAKMYQNTKDVYILGEHKNGKKVDNKEKNAEKKAAKK
jgi:hypothetical protein